MLEEAAPEWLSDEVKTGVSIKFYVFYRFGGLLMCAVLRSFLFRGLKAKITAAY